jgi:hypothetical protein
MGVVEEGQVLADDSFELRPAAALPTRLGVVACIQDRIRHEQYCRYLGQPPAPQIQRLLPIQQSHTRKAAQFVSAVRARP